MTLHNTNFVLYYLLYFSETFSVEYFLELFDDVHAIECAHAKEFLVRGERFQCSKCES